MSNYNASGQDVEMMHQTTSNVNLPLDVSHPQEAKGHDSSPSADWSSPDDPDNPINWSLSSRILHIMVPSALITAV